MVVPYIGTWIETYTGDSHSEPFVVVPYIGTWIETPRFVRLPLTLDGRTLYRYVD